MDRADPLRRMPLARDRVLGQFLRMAVLVAVDEGKPQDRPVETALSQSLLGRELTCRIGQLGVDLIVLIALAPPGSLEPAEGTVFGYQSPIIADRFVPIRPIANKRCVAIFRP